MIIADVARSIDKSVSRAITLLTTPAKSPSKIKSPKSVTPTETEDDPAENLEPVVSDFERGKFHCTLSSWKIKKLRFFFVHWNLSFTTRTPYDRHTVIRLKVHASLPQRPLLFLPNLACTFSIKTANMYT